MRSLLEGAHGSDGSFAIHSLNLPDHEYKRYGEADFVLVDSRGLLVLEVKGGTVALSDGEWQFENGRGQSRRKTEGPHQQAESGIQALRTTLRKRGARFDPSVFGWAVVFPFTHWKTEVVGLPTELVIDAEECGSAADFTAALDRVFRYWRARAEQSGRRVHQLDVRDYAEVLVPAFQFAPAPARCAAAVEEDVIRLTEQQCKLLEGLKSNRRILVEGGAGTGKTVLAHAAATEAKARGSSVAMVVSAPLLAAHLARMLPDVIVVPPEGLTRFAPASIDTVVVDEGQELANPEGLEAVARVLKGGLEGGRWRWFMDADNQTLHQATDPASISRLRESATCWRPPHNVRSTREIVELVKNSLHADVGISIIEGRGVRPVVQAEPSDKAVLDWVSAFVGERIRSGLDPSQIAVITAPIETRAVRRALDWLPESDALIVTGPEHLEAMRTRLVVTDPSTFRGMERPWTIVLCTDAFVSLDRAERYLYVALTRANAGLAMALSPAGRAWFEDLIMGLHDLPKEPV